jgi:hypothetical protein
MSDRKAKPKFWPTLEWIIPREYVEKVNRLTFRLTGPDGFKLIVERRNPRYPGVLYIRFEERKKE